MRGGENIHPGSTARVGTHLGTAERETLGEPCRHGRGAR